MDRVRRPLKTYSHLLAAKKIPSDYDLLSSRLHYYRERGFEVRTEVTAWYEAWQTGSLLRAADWEAFRDPRATTYASYVERQDRSECQVDGYLGALESAEAEQALAPAWVARLESLGALRYPFHGLQMVASYIGQLAPSGKITIAASFQAADEMRRVQRLAYRIAQRRLVEPEFAAGNRALWEQGPAFQPLRRVIERLLVTYDWGESFVVTSFCVKPVLDQLIMVAIARLAREQGDPMFARVLETLNEDCVWHRDYARGVVELALRAEPANRDVIAGWLARWLPPTLDAARALASAFFDTPDGASRALERVVLPLVTEHLEATELVMPTGAGS